MPDWGTVMGSLKRLLNPSSVAVIGGGAWCEAVVAQSRSLGFSGDIWPVHPARATVAGLDAFSSVDDLPDVPDAAFVGINRHATIDVIAALSQCGAGGAVCFASGFKEVGDGDALNTKLLVAAGDMPILGPNCYGALNALDGVALWPDQHGLKRVDRGVAIVAQSSNIAINLTMQQRGLPIAYVVTAGNQAQQGLPDIASELLSDERVTAIGIYVESFGDIPAFERLAKRAAELGKPIVALKVGRSDAAQRATVSHTASLAGSTAGSDALLARLGIANAPSLTVFLETLKVFHCLGRLGGRRITSLSCSGGEASVMADTASRHGLSFPELTVPQSETLKTRLGPMVALDNPLDYQTAIWRDRDAMRDVFATMTGEDVDLTCVVLDFPRPDICDLADWMVAVAAIEDAADQMSAPFALVASMPENLPEDVADRLLKKGIAPLCGFDDACAAISIACTPAMSSTVLPLLRADQFKAGVTLTEGQAKEALRATGMQVPTSFAGLSLVDVADAAEKIGFPVVLKGEGTAHKSEVGEVVLDLKDADAVLDAAKVMATPSYLVEEMVIGGLAELLIGVVRDPAHGFVVTIGAGGVLAELLDDTCSMLIPVQRDEVECALKGLKIHALLTGFRGQKPVDIETVLDSVMALQAYVIQNDAMLVEIEINPLICTPQGAVVADALIVKGET